MSDIIKSPQEAEVWFLSHSSGKVTCEDKNGLRKQCETYSEAIEWLTK